MPQTFFCQLPGRRGRTLLLGSHRVSIGHDGVASVPDEHLAWFEAQPATWTPVAGRGDVAPDVPAEEVEQRSRQSAVELAPGAEEPEQAQADAQASVEPPIVRRRGRRKRLP